MITIPSFLRIFAFAFISLFIWGCSREDEPDNNEPESNYTYDVYVSSKNMIKASYEIYKNGINMGVEGPSKERTIFDLHYQDHQIYGAGWAKNEGTTKNEALVFKNKNLVSLFSDPTGDNFSYAVFVDKGNIYKTVNNLVYKNNDILYTLYGLPTRIFVKDNDVYTIGITPVHNNSGGVWKNDQLLYYLGENIFPVDIKVVGKDIYVLGAHSSTFYVYKNSSLLYEFNALVSSSFDVVGSDVYVGGQLEENSISRAVVFKNNKILYTLGDGNLESYCSGVKVVDGHVFSIVQEGFLGRVYKDKEVLYYMEGYTFYPTDIEVVRAPQ